MPGTVLSSLHIYILSCKFRWSYSCYKTHLQMRKLSPRNVKTQNKNLSPGPTPIKRETARFSTTERKYWKVLVLASPYVQTLPNPHSHPTESLLSAEYVSRKKVVLTWLHLPRIKYCVCTHTHTRILPSRGTKLFKICP